MSVAPTLGVLAPVSGRPYAPDEDALLQRWVTNGSASAVWVRDLPCVPTGDTDIGQGVDPFAQLAGLAGRGVHPHTTGTASVILGTRHPLVVARAAVGAQLDSGGRFVLGLGTGGKSAVAAALGIADRPADSLAREWATIHDALRGDAGPRVDFALPTGYQPPPMWLASDDLVKWQAVGRYADGWQTFLTTPQDFTRRYAAVSATTPRPPTVAVRIDLRLLPEGDLRHPLVDPVRGVVVCGRRQLQTLLSPWRDLPVDHLIVNVRGSDPNGTLSAVREAWSLDPVPTGSPPWGGR